MECHILQMNKEDFNLREHGISLIFSSEILMKISRSECNLKNNKILGDEGNFYSPGRHSLTLPAFSSLFQTLTGRSNSNQTGYLGETVEMRCDALEGKTVRWRKDGAVLQTKIAGYGTSLRISIVQQSDEGIYICDVINSTGAIQASYSITLRVEGQF